MTLLICFLLYRYKFNPILSEVFVLGYNINPMAKQLTINAKQALNIDFLIKTFMLNF